MEAISRERVREYRRQMQELLDCFAKENDLKATISGGSFTPYNIEFKVELAIVTEKGSVLTRDAETFLHHAACQGLSPHDLGRVFQYGDRTYKIIGLRPRFRKAPIIAEDEFDRQARFPAEFIKALLPKADPSAPKPAAERAMLSG